MEEVPEELPQVGVVRLLVKSKSATVIEVSCEFCRKAAAKLFNWSRHFLFTDPLVFLAFRGGTKSLPRQTSSIEVHQDITKRFQIVASTLFYATNIRQHTFLTRRIDKLTYS